MSIATPEFSVIIRAECHNNRCGGHAHSLRMMKHAISSDLPGSDSRTCTFLFGSGGGA